MTWRPAPLTLTLGDFNGSRRPSLPRALTMDGVPAGADPEINDIGYYAPANDLVFYYGDVGYFNGIVRIGRYDTDIDVIRDQPDGFSVTVEHGLTMPYLEGVVEGSPAGIFSPTASPHSQQQHYSSVVGDTGRFGIRAPRISAALRSLAATHAA